MNGLKTGIALTIVIIALLAGNIYFGVTYISMRKELRQDQTALSAKKQNEKIIQFNQLFVEKVLKAQTEVDFETRLKLENNVRDLNDPDILAKWQAFTESKTELDAQTAVKNLLGTLAQKIAQ